MKATATIRMALCGLTLAGLSMPAMAQMKIGANPLQIVPGAKLQVDGNNTTTTPAKLLVDSAGKIGIGTAAPGTSLDVNGAITQRETAVAVSGNAATIPDNTSQVQLTGAATADITLTAPVAPNAGQRLVIFNNTTGGFPALLNGTQIAMGRATEFIYSNSAWQATGSAGATATGTPWDIQGNAATSAATNFVGTTDSVDLVTRTNNTERMRVTATGNIGIGTQTPHGSLQFANGIAPRKIVLDEAADNDQQYTGFGINPQALRYQVADTTLGHAFFAATGPTTTRTLMRIDGNGNVGIGAMPGGNVPHAPLQFANTAANRKIVLYEGANNDNEYYGFGINSGILRYQGGSHVFYANASPTTSTELMRIGSDGNVGIGTTAPGTSLDVNGAITNRETAVAVSSNAATIAANTSQVQLTGAATANIAVTAPAAPNAGQRLIIYNNTTGGFPAVLNGTQVPTGQALEFVYSNSGWRASNGGAAAANTQWGILGNTGTDAATNFIGTTDAVDFVTRTNNTERMRVTSTGNVGIGTTTPHAPLQLAGTLGNRKVVLYEKANNDQQFVGLGLNGAIFRYQLDTTTSSHVFYAGASATTSNELMRIQGNGKVGIGTSAPKSLLDLGASAGSSTSDSAGKKFAIYNNAAGTDFYGLGTSSGLLQFHAASTASEDPGMVLTGAGNLGIGTTAPGTSLDVNGAITNRETAVAVASNAATVAANTSQVQLTGVATANIAVTAPAAPNAGQRLIIYNNTTGGFPAVLNGTQVPTGQALEFVYSNSGWRASNGGAAAANTQWGILGNTGTSAATNFVGTTDAVDFVTRTNNTERMRVTSAGNVGIGTTTPNGALQFANGNNNRKVVLQERANNTQQFAGIGYNTVGGGMMYQVDTTSVAHVFRAGTSPTTSNELMRIQGDGNVGIGTTTPHAPLQFANTAVNRKIVLWETNNNDHEYCGFGVNGGTLRYQVNAAAANHVFFAPNAAGTASNELMRIQGDGNVAIGTSTPLSVFQNAQLSVQTASSEGIHVRSSVNDLNGLLFLEKTAASTSSDDFVFFRAGGVNIGSIGATGASGVQYNTTSDIRLKENIRSTHFGIEDVMKIQVRDYNYKADQNKQQQTGFLAQQLYTVFPNAVTVGGNDVSKPWLVDYSKVTPLLTKAIQDQQARIEAQQAEIDALKAANKELQENKVTTARLMERVKQMEQMLGIKEIEGSAKVAGK